MRIKSFPRAAYQNKIAGFSMEILFYVDDDNNKNRKRNEKEAIEIIVSRKATEYNN